VGTLAIYMIWSLLRYIVQEIDDIVRGLGTYKNEGGKATGKGK